MNWYCRLKDLKADLGIGSSDTDEDVALGLIIEGVSRAIDRWCGRRFFAMTEARYQTARDSGVVLLDEDLLSVSGFVQDSEGDGTFDGETWVEGTDYFLEPRNGWPKWNARATGFGNYSFGCLEGGVRITGEWGFGDGRRAAPYDAVNLTATVGTTTGTTVTLSAPQTELVQVGDTIRVGTGASAEKMFVTGIDADGDAITVTRGVNGSTAAVHSGAAVSVYAVPGDVRRFAAWLAGNEYSERGGKDFTQERMGDYYYMKMADAVEKKQGRILAGLVRAGMG